MNINWNTAGKAGRWLLLFLPLVAVGIALALLLTGGHQGARQASADATSEIEFSIAVGACGTANPTEANKCNIPVGDSFTLDMSWHGLSGAHAGDAPNVQMVIHWTGAVSGPTVANGKALTNNFGVAEECKIPEVVLEPGGDTTRAAVACGVLLFVGIATGVMGNADFNCDTAGVGVITLEHSAAQSLATDAALEPHWEDNAVDALQINCNPPAGQINIEKRSKDSSNQLLAGSCWEISILDKSGMSPVQKPLDTVSDNNAVGQCDTAGQAGLSDKNPAKGEISIQISGALQGTFESNELFIEEIKAPPKYRINEGGKQPCTLKTPKDPGDPDGKTTCFEGNPIVVGNERIEGNIDISFNDPFGGAQTGICVDINPGATNVCDGDDGSSDGSISVTLANGVYSVAIDPASIPSTVVAKDPTKVFADLDANASVSIKFSFNLSKPFFEKKKTLANLFLTAQSIKLDPNTCEESTDVAIFRQQLSSAPASQNEKGDPQDVRAFEYEVRFDGALVCVSWTPGAFVTNNNMSCLVDEEKGLIQVGCTTKKEDPQPPVDNSSLELGVIEVRAQPSLYSIIRATQDNGVVVQIRNDQCNLADLQGHPIASNKCPDSDLTIRWLEGDLNGDCIVDTADQQLIAFRWGIRIGVAVYHPRFDLVGKDNVITIKDVQFVFGRHNSKCEQFNNKGFAGPTNPPQPPLNKKTASP